MSYAQAPKLSLILDAAYELFGSNGFYETKMSEIAEKAGIAKGTLYLYFNSKEQLFTAITVRDFEQYAAELEFGLQKCHLLMEKLQFVAEHHLRYYFNRKQYTNLFFKAPNNDPELMKALGAFMYRYTHLIANIMDTHGLSEPMLLAKSYAGMLDMLKMDILFSPTFTETDLQQRVHFSVDLFMNGCAVQARA
ncbi:TetR/AcrR family transcriptional regulator [Paenibacillus sp. 481]|uniref:TetR/AcrR family transcriptional regulator n=1 Tax=Paenibacillus sp. 481 TaxID=2835869 RepID=UPI001E36CB7C|nr:TetR/AcrR family transcriptional regulator [Paenibacillus sp. 481]UHA72585.1 helix-turn-helix transcriptional regulator [Paenibacillus sp. 481]